MADQVHDEDQADEPIELCGLTFTEISRRARASRVEQGLPATISSPDVLRKVLAILTKSKP